MSLEAVGNFACISTIVHKIIAQSQSLEVNLSGLLRLYVACYLELFQCMAFTHGSLDV